MSSSASDEPSVSVIVPTLNRSDRLTRAVDSVLEQDYSASIEVLVVFDGAVSDTAMERTLPRRSVRALGTGQRSGPGPARNQGAAAATGTLIAFCDDDDVWLPHKLTAQVAALRRDSALACFSGVRIHSRGGAVTRIPHRAELDLEHVVRTRVASAHLSTMVTTQEAWRTTVGEFDEEIPGSYGEDFDWLIRATRAGTVTAVGEPLVEVWWEEDSFFSGKWQMIVDGLGYLTDKHAELRTDRIALARVRGQQAFALAGLGRRRDARRVAVETLRTNPREARGILALAAASGLVRAETILALVKRTGRGI